MLDRLDRALTRALQACPALVLVPSSLSLLPQATAAAAKGVGVGDGERARRAHGEAALARLKAEVEAARAGEEAGAAGPEGEEGYQTAVEVRAVWSGSDSPLWDALPA